MIGPALVLAVIVGLFHVSAYVFIRGRAGARLPLLVVAAVLGAWAGDAVGGRMGSDPIRIGEFNVVAASVVAWLAIGLVAVLAVLVPPPRPRVPDVVTTTLVRSTREDDATPAESEDDRARGLAERSRSLDAAPSEPEAQASR